MELAREMLSYPFLVRTLVGGILVSLCVSLLGASLVLKWYFMIGDGLSHVSSGALLAALAIGWSSLKLSIPVVMLMVFFLLWTTENGEMKSDTVIAMIPVSALAVSTVVTSMTTGMTTDVSSYMFGSTLAMGLSDVRLSVALSVIVLRLFLFCYDRIFAVTFDESLAKATGVWAPRYNILIVVLTMVTIVLGMRMTGVVLISSLIIFPAPASMWVFKSFRDAVLSAGVVSVVRFGIGMVMSYRLSTPVGASAVSVNLAAFILLALVQTVIRRLIRKG